MKHKNPSCHENSKQLVHRTSETMMEAPLKLNRPMHPGASYEENACQQQYQKFPHHHPEKSKQLSGKKI